MGLGVSSGQAPMHVKDLDGADGIPVAAKPEELALEELPIAPLAGIPEELALEAPPARITEELPIAPPAGIAEELADEDDLSACLGIKIPGLTQKGFRNNDHTSLT